MELSTDKEKLYSADEIRQRLGISTCGLKKGSEPGNGADFELLAELVEHGFRKVEVGADYGPDHFDYHNLDSIAELRRRYEDCGAAIYSVHAPYGYLPVVAGDPESKWNLYETDPDKRESVLADFRQLVEAMAVAGAELTVIHFWTWGREHHDYHVDTINRMVELARPHGIRISIETGGNMHHLSGFVDWFDFPDVGITCDTGHTGNYYAGLNLLQDEHNVHRVMRTAAGKLNHLHLSDCTSGELLPRSHPTRSLPPTRHHQSPGRGSHNWAAIFHELKQTDYPGCFMFEVLSTDPERKERLSTFVERLMAAELGTMD